MGALDTIDFAYEVSKLDLENSTEGNSGEVEMSPMQISPTEHALLVETTTNLDTGHHLDNKVGTVMYRVTKGQFIAVVSFKASEFVEVPTESVNRELTVTNTLTVGCYDMDIAVNEHSAHSEGDDSEPISNKYVDHYV